MLYPKWSNMEQREQLPRPRLVSFQPQTNLKHSCLPKICEPKPNNYPWRCIKSHSSKHGNRRILYAIHVIC